MEKLGQNNIYSQYLGNKAILRTYKGTDLINEYVPLYTPPVDWSDIRIDCPENSIALYAAHSADYSSYDNLGFTATMSASDLTTTGSPTIVDGVASGFSSSNYLKTSLSLSSDNEKIRIKIRFKTPETFVSGNTNILTFGNSLTTNNCIRIYTGSSYSRISSFGNDINTGSPNLQTDTFYVVDVLIDGNKQYSYLYDDNNTKLAESANTTKTANFNNIGFFGGRFYSPIQVIDFNNTSIEVNDVYYLLPYGSSNGYNVFIDGTQYGSTYASGSQCDITWSSLALTTGDNITTPTALKAHKIWIEPATTGNNITAFQCARVAASGTEQQGVLWGHYNLINAIKISTSFGTESTIRNTLLEAITAKNNLITYTVASSAFLSGFYSAYAFCSSLEYLPVLKAENTTYPSGNYIGFRNVKAKKIVIKNNNGNEILGCLNNTNIEELSVENGLTLGTGTGGANIVISSTLKKLPKINENKYATFRLVSCPSLEPTNIDDRFNDIRTLFHFYGGSAQSFTALKSLRVSNEAPFDNATAPQINVSYTGMDRNALVQLFNDLPYNVGYEVVGSPTINNGVASGFLNRTNYLEISSQVIPFSTANSWEIKTAFVAKEGDGTDWQEVFDFSSGANGVQMLLHPTNKKVSVYIENTQIFSANYEISFNVLYYVKVQFTGSAYIFSVSTDNINWTEVKRTESTTKTSNSDTSKQSIGISKRYSRDRNWLGSIDLNNTYIKINDVYWFRGQPAMTKTLSCVGCTGNQLSVVGSPTIADGVVSGFSGSSYVQSSTTFPGSTTTSLEFSTKFNISSFASTSTIASSTTSTIPFHLAVRDNKFRLYPGREDIYKVGDFVLSENVDYYIKLFWDSVNGWKLQYSTNGINYTTDFENYNPSDSTPKNNYIVLGRNYVNGGQEGLLGSIDLNNTYIKVNGETWFDINNCLLPEDRAIATNKNWTLTLS